MAILNKYLNNKFLKTLEPLSKLSVDKLSEIANKSSIESIPAGRNLFRQGEKDKLSYYLVTGQIELLTSGSNKTETIKAKTPEAKYPIAQQLPRPVTGRTKVNSEILTIDTSLLEMLIESDDNPSGAYEVTEINSEDENGWMLKFLQSRAFLQIPTENIQKILMSMEEITVKKGQSIVTQGESNDFYYIVKTGKCSVSRRPSPNTEDVQIAILAAGDGFGEEALITEGHRNATVRMLDDGVLMRLTKDDFISLLVKPLLDYIHLDELKSRVSSGDLLVDVRQHKDFMTEHLDGAVNTPLSMIRLKLSTFNADRNVIVYCNDSNRSTAAAFLLIQHGITCSILRDGINSYSSGKTSANTMLDSISNLDAVSKKKLVTVKASSANNKLPNIKESSIVPEKIKNKINELNKQNIQAETARKQAEAELEHHKKIETEKNSRILKETEKKRLQEAELSKQAEEERLRLKQEKLHLEEETKKIREKAVAEKNAAQQELKELTEQYNKHKQEIEAKDKAERKAQVLRERAEAEKFEAQRELERQAEESRKNKKIIKEKQEAERQAQALREKAESERLTAERELERQAEESRKSKKIIKEKQEAERQAQALREKAESEKLAAERELQKQKQITEESQRKVKLETEKIRQQADKELTQLRKELEKTKSSVEERVKSLKEKESLRANEEIRNRQQHANDAIKESIEKARYKAEADAAKVRQQALLEVQSLQKEIELKKQKLETEAEQIRLEAERDRATTLELARKQAQEIVFRSAEEAEFISVKRQELDNEAAKIQLQAEAERHATLEEAKLEAHNIIKKTAEEAQQLDLHRQRIEDEVTKLKSQAEYEREQTLVLAQQEAEEIRLNAERNTQQQENELKEHRKRLKSQAEKELEQQRTTMELSLKQAEEIRIQAEKEAEKLRLIALQSATSAPEEIVLSSKDNTDVSQEASSVNFGSIDIPGTSNSHKPSMIESEAKSLAQEIVSKLEKAESNRIKDTQDNNTGNGLSLASASLKRRSDGKIVLEGDEDLFIFKEPKSYTEEQLYEIKESLEGKNFKQSKNSGTPKSPTSQSNDLSEFSFDEPDFDLVDELPVHLEAKSNSDTSSSDFSDFELHQPSDIRAQIKNSSKKPAQRIVAFAASLFVAIGVGITFLGVNSDQSTSQDVATAQDDTFNATRVSGLATNNIEIDKKIMTEAEHEFEKLLSKWKKSQAKQDETLKSNSNE